MVMSMPATLDWTTHPLEVLLSVVAYLVVDPFGVVQKKNCPLRIYLKGLKAEKN